MKKILFCALFVGLSLSACARQEEPAPPLREDAAESLAQTEQLLEDASARPEKSEIRVTVQSKTEILPVELYVGQGYSIYITEEGWRLDRDREEGGILEDTWESTRHGDDAELKVSMYPNVTVEDAKSRFAAQADDYVFDADLTGDWGTPCGAGTRRTGRCCTSWWWTGRGTPMSSPGTTMMLWPTSTGPSCARWRTPFCPQNKKPEDASDDASSFFAKTMYETAQKRKSKPEHHAFAKKE